MNKDSRSSFARFSVLATGPLLLWACANIQHNEAHRAKAAVFNEAGLQLQNEASLVTKDRQPFTGIVYSLAPNGRDTVAVGGFVNGKEEGEWRKYFADGRLMEKRFYTGGKKTGVYTAWWPNGRRRLLYLFAGGEYEGTCRDWAENGLPLSEMNYREGHEEGPQKQWYENGKIKANYVIKDGRRYGLLGTKNCVNVSDSVFKER